MKYHRDLMMSILSGKAQIAKAVNATMISLDQAPAAYAEFDQGAPPPKNRKLLSPIFYGRIFAKS